MNYKHQGEVTELRFYLKAFELGFVVSKPFGDNQKYDFILDAGGRLSRIQIKSCGVIDRFSRNNNRYRINASFGNSKRNSYSKNEIDFLVVYIIPMDAWYIVPVEAINGVKTLGFHPHIKSNGKMEKYLNWWDGLK